MKHFSGFLYLPQSSRSLLLIDVDKVAHHTALDHISLSLHSDLEGQAEVMSINLNLRQWKHAQPVWNAVGSPSQVWGFINRAPIGMWRRKKLVGVFGKQDVLKYFLSPCFQEFSSPCLTSIIAAVYRSALVRCLALWWLGGRSQNTPWWKRNVPNLQPHPLTY